MEFNGPLAMIATLTGILISAGFGAWQYFALQNRKHRFEIFKENRAESKEAFDLFLSFINQILGEVKESTKTKQISKDTKKLKDIQTKIQKIGSPEIVEAFDAFIDASVKFQTSQTDEQRTYNMEEMFRKIERVYRAYRASIGHDDSRLKPGIFSAMFGDKEVKQMAYDACRNENYKDIKPRF